MNLETVYAGLIERRKKVIEAHTAFEEVKAEYESYAKEHKLPTQGDSLDFVALLDTLRQYFVEKTA